MDRFDNTTAWICTNHFRDIQKRTEEQQQQAQSNATGNDPASTTETPISSTPRRAKRRYNSVLSLQRIRTLPPAVGATLAAEENRIWRRRIQGMGQGQRTEGRYC